MMALRVTELHCSFMILLMAISNSCMRIFKDIRYSCPINAISSCPPVLYSFIYSFIVSSFFLFVLCKGKKVKGA
jgi:hypothetical protein